MAYNLIESNREQMYLMPVKLDIAIRVRLISSA